MLKARMFHVALYEPEIPPNTGNIIRLCANCGAQLHLIKPLAFTLDDKNVRRAGLDYHDLVNVKQHDSFTEFLREHPSFYAFSTKGSKTFSEISYNTGDTLLFGPETRGLPMALLESLPQERVLRIPMLPNNRSLNLSNAVAIAVYEVWRQLGYRGCRK